MKKYYNIKIIVFYLTISLIIINISISNSETINIDNINNQNIKWDIIVPDDYPTIQDAINHAVPYNTIYVRSGVYNENIIIDENALHIIGENFQSTIINPNKGNAIEIKAFLVSIGGFNITNAEIGLSFSGYSPTYNNIYGNNFYKNNIGIKIKDLERSNKIYHNNFIQNNQNAYDPTENNYWYDTEIIQGNFWDDYTGNDTNEDGIGDTPYNLPGNRTQDKYPLMNPYCFQCRPFKPSTPKGIINGKINQEYNYSTSSIDPKQGKLYYWFDWNDNTNSRWIGPYQSGEICNLSYIWTEKGNYEIRVRSKNEYGAQSEWSDPLIVSMPKQYNQFQILINNMINHFPILESILSKYL